MSHSGPTPGPWKKQNHLDPWGEGRIGPVWVEDFDNPADADLIAAAPDLLAVAKEIRDEHDSGVIPPIELEPETVDRLRAAIEKAEGSQ